MFPFGVTIPVTVPQRSEIPEGLMNNPVYIIFFHIGGRGGGRASLFEESEIVVKITK
jgi:hypothetical protein